MEGGQPWRDPRWSSSSTSSYNLSTGGGGILKRSLTEMERQHQQTALLQQALLLRAVRQKTFVEASPVSHLLSPSGYSGAGGSDMGSLSSASSFASMNLVPGFVNGPRREPNMNMQMNRNSNMSMNMGVNGNGSGGFVFSSPASAPANDNVMRNRLQELERKLLCDDDEEEEVSASGSAVINSDWDDTIQQLLGPPTVALLPPPQIPAVVPQVLTSQLSPSTSSSSTASSSASCSPPSATTRPRQLLSDTASAISEGNLEMALANLTAIKRTANPHGDTEQRLAAMMVTSLTSRINSSSSSQLQTQSQDLCGPEQRAATQLLHDLSPCFKLGLLAANLVILKTCHGSSNLHIIDFDIGSGTQHASLIQALGEKQRITRLKITVVYDPTSPFTHVASANVRTVRERLMKVAQRMAVDLKFNMVTSQVSELNSVSLLCEPGETLAVNLAFILSRVPDESVSPLNPRDELLRRIRALKPHIVTVTEYEMNGNTAPFTTRFNEACLHYGSILESLDSTFGRDSLERARIEGALARKAVNLVSKEGAERLERCEVFGKWRARMSMAGLNLIQPDSGIVESVRTRLSSLKPNPGFTVKEEGGSIGFGWAGRVLTVSSVWH